jgi:hypothetical protein
MTRLLARINAWLSRLNHRLEERNAERAQQLQLHLWRTQELEEERRRRLAEIQRRIDEG